LISLHNNKNSKIQRGVHSIKGEQWSETLNAQASEAMSTTTATSSSPFLRPFLSLKPLPSKSSLHLPKLLNRRPLHLAVNSTRCFSPAVIKAKRGVSGTQLCFSSRRKPILSSEEGEDNLRKVLQITLWVAGGVYILWLFLLPYAPVRTLFTFFKFSICHEGDVYKLKLILVFIDS